MTGQYIFSHLRGYFIVSQLHSLDDQFLSYIYLYVFDLQLFYPRSRFELELE
jgi:hypothetical protein